MMETTTSIGGRPRDTFANPYLVTVEDKEGNAIAKKCTYCDHQFSRRTSITRIKAHLGGVPGRGVAPCKKVPSNVKEDAKNAMPSSSNNLRSDAIPLLSSSIATIPANCDMQQPSPQECCTPSPPTQIMSLIQEQWPKLMDGFLQQSNANSTCLDELLNPLEMETAILEDLESQAIFSLDLWQDNFQFPSPISCLEPVNTPLPSVGPNILHPLQPVLESLQINPPPSSVPESHYRDLVSSPIFSFEAINVPSPSMGFEGLELALNSLNPMSTEAQQTPQYQNSKSVSLT